MSRPKRKWWGYVKAMIRAYPYTKLKYGNGIADTSTTEGREHNAVLKAIEATERYSNGRERMEIIRLVLWDESHTLAGAALEVPCGEATAWRWHGDFIRMVASYYGLMDD